MNTGRALTHIVNRDELTSALCDLRPVTINLSQQVIETVNGTVINEVRGDVHLSDEDRKLLSLVEEHGEEKAGELTSAVHELSDTGIAPEKRLSAGQRLKAFLYALGSRADKIGVALLQKYIEGKLGF